MFNFQEAQNATQFGWWKLCRIGPSEARQLLDSMVRNRAPTPSRIAMYQTAIDANEWLVTHQGIAVHEGKMVDGQNRCHAIIKSGKSVDVWVYFSTGVDYMREIDRQQSRRDSQVATICGIDATAQDVAIASIVDVGRVFNETNSWKNPTHKLLERLARLEPVMSWLKRHGFATKRKGLSQAAIVGAIGRGVLIHGQDVMRRFVDIYLNMPSCERHESAAARLRELALQLSRNNRTHRLEVYLKAAAAINAFSEQRPLARLYATDMPDEPLPIDWSTQREALARLAQ